MPIYVSLHVVSKHRLWTFIFSFHRLKFLLTLGHACDHKVHILLSYDNQLSGILIFVNLYPSSLSNQKIFKRLVNCPLGGHWGWFLFRVRVRVRVSVRVRVRVLNLLWSSISSGPYNKRLLYYTKIFSFLCVCETDDEERTIGNYFQSIKKRVRTLETRF